MYTLQNKPASTPKFSGFSSKVDYYKEQKSEIQNILKSKVNSKRKVNQTKEKSIFETYQTNG